MRRIQHIAVVLILVFEAEYAFAGGFQVTQLSARGLGIGDAGYVSLGEPVLLQNNPALMGFVRGTVFSFGSTVLMPDTRFTPKGSGEIKMASQVIFPPNVSFTHNFDGDFALGISGSIPFAMNTEWDESWVGALQAVRSDFRLVCVSPGFSIALSPRLSLGFALNIGFPRMQMNHRFSLRGPVAATGLESFDGSGATTFGATVGLLLRPTNTVTLGVSYMSRMKIDIDKGNITYSELPDSLTSMFPATNASFSFSTPDIVKGGLAIRVTSWLSAEANVQYALWSALHEVTIRYPEEALKADPSLWTAIPLKWNNSWTFHAGLEIGLGDIIFRGGYMYDQTPIPDETFLPSLPDADRRGLSFGLGYFVSEGLRLDFGYQYLEFLDRTISPRIDGNASGVPTGKYSTTWTVLGFNVSYFWD